MRIASLVLAAMLAQPTTQHHGAAVMGFDQEKTVHRFTLYSDGGAIDVSVKDASNDTDRRAIRSHLPHISQMFSAGNFDAPMLVHESTNVPGTADMTRLRTHITYAYVETPTGGRVDIRTSDPSALEAIHAFLRFQIADHGTGDSTAVRKR
jgi:hypothetical protein